MELPPLDLARITPRLGERVRLGDVAVESRMETPTRVRDVITDGARRFIVRRPKTAAAAEGLRREDGLLGFLGETSVPCPAPMVPLDPADSDPFDVISHVEGHRIRSRLPITLPRTSSMRHDLAAAMVDALIRIHDIDITDAGLDVARAPEPADLLVRWRGRVEEAGIRSGAADTLIGRLERSVPPPTPPCLIHGLFHLSSLVFDHEDPGHVAAVINWEFADVGDPQVDLGLLLALWAEEMDEPVTNWLPWTQVTAEDGFFSRATVAHEYMQRSRHDLRYFEWFVALAYLQLAVMAADFDTPQSRDAIEPMIEQALDRAGHSGVSGLAG